MGANEHRIDEFDMGLFEKGLLAADTAEVEAKWPMGSFQAGGGETVYHFHSGVEGWDRLAASTG